MSRILIILMLLIQWNLLSQEKKEVWWGFGVEGSRYTYIREDINETPMDETKANGTLSVGLKAHRYAFKPERKIGSWLSLDIKIPFRSIVDGKVEIIEAEEGSIQALTNINIGLGFRSHTNKAFSIYGGIGFHTYLSYLHAYTLFSSPVLEEARDTEIEQYDIALGIGAELGVRQKIGDNSYLMFGSTFSRDVYSYQDTKVLIEQDPPIRYIAVGEVPQYKALNISPHLTFGWQY